MNAQIRVYFGCALSGATHEYKATMRQLAAMLRLLEKIQLLDFFSHKFDRTPEKGEIYEIDILEGVEKADVMFAEISSPSTGLGFELGRASMRGIPIYMFMKKGVKVSNLITDFAAFYSGALLIEYESYPDFEEQIRKITSQW